MPPALTTISHSIRPLSVCDRPHAAAVDLDAGDPRLGEDRGAALAGPLGERQGELARVEVAVGGQEGGAVHALDRHRREELLGLLGGHEMERQPEGLGPGGLALQLLHPLGRRGEPERADLAPARLELRPRL